MEAEYLPISVYGSVFKTSAGILSAPAAFPFFIAFIAFRISLFEGGLILIVNSVGILVSSYLSMLVVEVVSISSRYSFHLWICPIDVIGLPSLSLIGTTSGRMSFVNRLIALNMPFIFPWSAAT